MARKKRSEKSAEVAFRPAPTPTKAIVGTTVVSALCPVCGRSIPENRVLKIGYAPVGKVGYFDAIDWDRNKPFGTQYIAGGRNSFQQNAPIQPQDAPELFEAVKRRFLQALREWVEKGWISEEEIHPDEGGENEQNKNRMG